MFVAMLCTPAGRILKTREWDSLEDALECVKAWDFRAYREGYRYFINNKEVKRYGGEYRY